MGKKLDALFGRTFKTAKFKPVVTLAISRLAVLKNQRQARLRLARSDVLQLLQLGHHERALLRVEHVIKEQNMLDVYDKIEGYCNLVLERVHLIEQERECPEELKEAASGLLYAASRCGDFPEIQEIREMFTSRFGKEFAAGAIELRNNCGVHRQIIQKLSTRLPSLESRMKELKEIASENSIVLQLEESSVMVEEQFNVEKKQNKPGIREENLHILPNRVKDGELPDSFKGKQKYKDVADAAQAAFESAASAAAAARAAVELSRSESYDPDDHNSSSPKPRKASDGQDFEKPQLEDTEVLNETQGELNKNINKLDKLKHNLSSNSADEILKVDAEIEVDPFDKELVFDESDDDTDNKLKKNQYSEQISSMYGGGRAIGSGSQQLVSNKLSRSRMQSAAKLNLEKRPISVRNR